MPDYLTPAQYAARLGISTRRIHALLVQGRVPGSYQHMGRWAIPEGAQINILPAGRPRKAVTP